MAKEISENNKQRRDNRQNKKKPQDAQRNHMTGKAEYKGGS